MLVVARARGDRDEGAVGAVGEAGGGSETRLTADVAVAVEGGDGGGDRPGAWTWRRTACM